MFKDPSEMSLIEILQERVDTCFDGWKLEPESVAGFESRDSTRVVQDGAGNHYVTDNDHVEIHEREGRNVAILVADHTDKNTGVSHPHPEVPHLIGLYVREPYRSRGLASGLIQEFLESTGSERFVVDCTESLKPFYQRFEQEVVFLDEFKRF